MAASLPIGEFLVRKELLSPRALAQALKEQETKRQRLISMLILRAELEIDDAATVLSEQSGYPAAFERHLERRDTSLAKVLSGVLCARYGVIPIGKTAGGRLVVGARDPSPELVTALEEASELTIELCVVPAILLDRLVRATFSLGIEPGVAFPATHANMPRARSVSALYADSQPPRPVAAVPEAIDPTPPRASRPVTAKVVIPERKSAQVQAIKDFDSAPILLDKPKRPTTAPPVGDKTLPRMPVVRGPATPIPSEDELTRPRRAVSEPGAPRSAPPPPPPSRAPTGDEPTRPTRPIDPDTGVPRPAAAAGSSRNLQPTVPAPNAPIPPEARPPRASEPAAEPAIELPPRAKSVSEMFAEIASEPTPPLTPTPARAAARTPSPMRAPTETTVVTGPPRPPTDRPEVTSVSAPPRPPTEPTERPEGTSVGAPPRPPPAPGMGSPEAVAREIERAISRATADRVLITFAGSRFKSALLLMIADGVARGARGQGPRLTTVQTIAVPIEAASIIQVAHDDGVLTREIAVSPTQDRIAELMGTPTPLAVPIHVDDSVVAVLVVGEPAATPVSDEDLVKVVGAFATAYKRLYKPK